MVMGPGGGKGIGTGVYQQIAAFAILADHQIMGLGSGFQLIKCHFDTVLSFVVSGFQQKSVLLNTSVNSSKSALIESVFSAIRYKGLSVYSPVTDIIRGKMLLPSKFIAHLL